ncbi:MAG: hypothetical protein COA42_17310 [Alteromonadaceae bacterium]|nr:MAG: hypothetical protein COA42_17310 [Alteromonadaceae bacterium]
MNKPPKLDKNRIPSDSLTERSPVARWDLPPMDDQDVVIKTIKNQRQIANRDARDARLKRRGSSINEQKKQQAAAAIAAEEPVEELIEDYKGRVKAKPLTAEALAGMVDEAQKEGFEAGHQEGYAEGNTEGRSQGLKQGQDQAYKETKAMLDEQGARLKSIADTLMSPLHGQEQALENMLVDMAVQMAQQIISTEIRYSPQYLYGIVKRTLDALPVGAKNITVSLNNDDAALLEAYSPQDQRNWQIRVDPALSNGSCRVDTDDSLVEFDVVRQINDYIEGARSGGTSVSNIAEVPLQEYRDADTRLTVDPELSEERPNELPDDLSDALAQEPLQPVPSQVQEQPLDLTLSTQAVTQATTQTAGQTTAPAEVSGQPPSAE